MRRAIIFKATVLILETWEKPNELGNWVWFNSFDVDSIYITDKSYDKCINKQRIERLRKIMIDAEVEKHGKM